MKLSKHYINIGFLIASCCLVSCKDPVNTTIEPNTNAQTKSKPSVSVPAFNTDSAFNSIKTQVSFGPRVPNTNGHEACKKYMIAALKTYGCTVTEQNYTVKAYDNKMLKGTNVIAAINPLIKENRILLTAHWDTRPIADQDNQKQTEPIDGANDAGSGVGVLIEMARVLTTDTTFKLGVDIILWDCEDYGQPSNSGFAPMEDSYCLGSQYWAKNKPYDYTAKFAINLDMVGAPNATFFKDGISLQYAFGVVEKVWKAASNAGFGNVFVNQSTGPTLTDDHLYVNTIAKIPCIDIIHHDESTPSNFPISWHTHNDNLDGIDKNSLKAVGQSLLQMLYEEQQLLASQPL
jgi:glutaminyl-peptide cyclotransferase